MLSVDDLLAFRSVSEARLSPDGGRVAFVVDAALAGAHAEPEGSRVWLVETAAGGAARPLTQGPGRDSAPAWSPDGRQLAFLSDRAEPGVARLYLLPLDGGEARLLDTGVGEVKGFAWSPDGGRIALVRTDAGRDGDDRGHDQVQEGRADSAVASGGEGTGREDKKGAPVVVEEEPRYDRVWTIDLASGERRRATAAAVQVWELAWLPDGAALALVVADEPTASGWYRCRLARLDLASGAMTTLYTPPPGRQVARPTPAPDGTRVAFVSCSWSDPGMSGGELWVVPAVGEGVGAARNLTAGAPFSVNVATWMPDGRALLYDAYDDNAVSVGTVTAAERLDGESRRQRLWRGPHSLGYGGLSVATGGTTFAVARDDAREPGDAWLGQVEDGTVNWRRLTDLHPHAGATLPAGWQDLRWTAPDGVEIGGLVMRPVGGEGPAPLVVIVHGGPTAMAGHRFASRGLYALAPLLAARGIATLMPNYRGSNGRGVAFAEANRGDMGGGDFADIMAGIDQLVTTGVADPERLGIGGWSYGGYMAMWAVTQTDRFRAAVAGAGIADWLSFHGASILHAWDSIFYDADPYDPAGPYRQRSPVLSVARVRTPVLLLHGDADRDVPPDQSREFFRALKDRGVETQLVLYPGAAHGPRDPRHVRDIAERGLAWFVDRL